MLSLGCGSHTDYECFTLLSQSNQSGLQVLNNKGEWINAKPIENTFVVNIGDLMQRWTDDQFKSTIHRVINTSGTTMIHIIIDKTISFNHKNIFNKYFFFCFINYKNLLLCLRTHVWYIE